MTTAKNATLPKEGACVIYVGPLDRNGYGRLHKKDPNGRHVSLAHRWAWIQANGPVPEGHDVHHACRRHACVNVKHLELLPHGKHSHHHWAMRHAEAVVERSAEVLDKTTDGVSITDAAKHLGVTPQTIRNWIKRGLLPATQFGPNIIRIDPVDLDKMRREA